MAYLAAALDALLALRERNSSSTLLVRSLRSILKTLTNTRSDRCAFSFSPTRLCSAIEAGLRTGSPVKAKTRGGSSSGHAQPDPVGRVLRVLLLCVKASFKRSPTKKASAGKRKPATTQRKSRKKPVAISRKAAEVKKRPSMTSKNAKRKVTAASAATNPLAKKARTQGNPKPRAVRATSAGAAGKKRSSVQKKKMVVRRKKTVTKARAVSTTAPAGKRKKKKRAANKLSSSTFFGSGAKVWGSLGNAVLCR